MLRSGARKIVSGHKKGERKHATMGIVVVGRCAVAAGLFAVQNVSVDGDVSGGHDRAR